MGNRFMDLIEANKQREHELRMKRRNSAVGWAVVGGIFGVAAALSGLRRRDNDTVYIVED